MKPNKPIKVFSMLLLGGFLVYSLSYLAFAQAEESSVEHLRKTNPERVDWKKKGQNYWKDNLTSLQYRVCRNAGTERAFSGYYNKSKSPGSFHCSSCGLKLFSSKDKFESGTGWPSFTKPSSVGSVSHKEDGSYGMSRTEVVCSRCDAHLGHVFSDGPEPTGKRYCINSVCLVHEDILSQKAKK